jgi:hypothetical protein
VSNFHWYDECHYTEYRNADCCGADFEHFHLLLPLLDHFRSEDLTEGSHVGAFDDVAEGQGVENHFRNAEQHDLDGPARDRTGSVRKDSEVELCVGQILLKGPNFSFLANVVIGRSSAWTDSI